MIVADSVTAAAGHRAKQFKELPLFATLEIISIFSSVSSDLTTPLKNSLLLVTGVTLAASLLSWLLVFLLRKASFLSLWLKRLMTLWPIVPLLFCGFLWGLRLANPQAARTGGIAAAAPAVQSVQAAVLPVAPDVKVMLRVQAALASGDDAQRRTAVSLIADVKDTSLKRPSTARPSRTATTT